MIIRDYFLEVLEKHHFPHHPLINSIGYEKREQVDDDPYVWECRQNGESQLRFPQTEKICHEYVCSRKICYDMLCR